MRPRYPYIPRPAHTITQKMERVEEDIELLVLHAGMVQEKLDMLTVEIDHLSRALMSRLPQDQPGAHGGPE